MSEDKSTTSITVKNVPEDLKNRFKSAAALQGKKMNVAFIEAIEDYVNKEERKRAVVGSESRED